MPSRRSRFEIYIDTLTEIKSGTVLPTRIMGRANLSWTLLNQILGALTVQGLIVEQSMGDDKRTKRAYVVTEKGNKLLNYFNRARNLLNLEKAPEVNS